ncbi:MAG: hypothetical protein A3J63_04330 [Candidatus Moranbacteria bacterium RIFCSPHIGHO2_02_FULL_40_12b]|nr:MAG: hypothetical protein A3J63_04330 [Candidatus Moranbacteria bacterium RIFCSPHIGHO2_02_FULL_40_12b]
MRKKHELNTLVFAGLVGAVLGLIFTPPGIVILTFFSSITALVFPEIPAGIILILVITVLFAIGFSALLLMLRHYNRKSAK